LNGTALARVALVVAYFWLAHAASARHDPVLAALALGDIAAIVMLEPLLRANARAWGVAALVAVALVALARTTFAPLVLLLVPAAIVALVAWTFGRTLRKGRVPLITRLVTALDGVPLHALAPDLLSYTRALTATWAIVLGVLAIVDLVLALCAVPGGLLEGMGIAPPLAVPHAAWSWFANGLTYGLIGGLFIGEYYYRVRRFPGRYTSFFDFLRRMGRLGPGFWREALRDAPLREPNGRG
jgi:uncharacterized membrane protein